MLTKFTDAYMRYYGEDTLTTAASVDIRYSPINHALISGNYVLLGNARDVHVSGSLYFNLSNEAWPCRDPVGRCYIEIGGLSGDTEQSGRSPKLVALFSATNFSSYIKNCFNCII